MAEEVKIEIVAKDKFSGTFNNLLGKLPSVKTLAIGAGAAIAGFGTAVAAMTRQTANAYDQVAKFSSRIGISTEELSKYQYVAQLSGVNTRTLNIAFQRMTRRIGEATTGIGQANPAFEALGISIKDIINQDPDKQFETIAEALEKVENASERTALAAKIFDSEGVAVLQTLANGTEGLRQMKEEAEKFGLVVSSKAAKNAEEFNDSLTRVGGAFKGLRNYMAEQVMPILTRIANTFANFVANNRDSIIEFGTKVASVFSKILEVGAYVVAALVDSWRGLKVIFEVVKIALYAFVEAFVEAFDWLVEKWGNVLEALNFKGVFDEDIEQVKNFGETTASVLGDLNNAAEKSKTKLKEIAIEPTATEKTKEFVENFKQGLSDMATSFEAAPKNMLGQIVGSGGDGDGGQAEKIVKDQQTAVNRINEMWNEYFLSKEEQLLLWYEKEYEMVKNNEDAKEKLYHVYLERLMQLKQEKEIETQQKILDLKKQGQEEEALWYEEDLILTENFSLAKLLTWDSFYKKRRDQHSKHVDAIGKIDRQREGFVQKHLDRVLEYMKESGKTGFKIYQALATAEAIISTAGGVARALREYKYPFSLIVGALVAASGAIQISKIQSQKYQGHAGITKVPSENEYLLAPNERVLSAPQNKDLTSFLEQQETGEGVGSAREVNNYITIHILENATNADAMLDMSQEDWNDIVDDQIIPAMNRLALQGIRPTR